MSESTRTCAAPEGCDRDAVARGLCMKHYLRERKGKLYLGALPELVTCASCLVEFKPANHQQKFCSRQCGVNLRSRESKGYLGPVPRVRACDYCGAQFTRQGRGRKTYCSPECAKTAQSVRSHMRDYGVTKAQYRALHEAQGGVCAICKNPETQRRKTLLSVDHDHGTGKVRGLLCGSCNAALGLLGDSAARIRAAIAYLEAVA